MSDDPARFEIEQRMFLLSEQENAAKLQDLAQAADVLAHAGIAVNAALLKRKFANGRTLLQVAQAGESARDAALQLVHIHKREKTQRERMATRFANRGKTAPSADFDLPSASDDAGAGWMS